MLHYINIISLEQKSVFKVGGFYWDFGGFFKVGLAQ